jgi:hypothetical protein
MAKLLGYCITETASVNEADQFVKYHNVGRLAAGAWLTITSSQTTGNFSI